MTNNFESGKAMAGSVVDYFDAMRADIGIWSLASIDMHAGYWFKLTDICHKIRMQIDETAHLNDVRPDQDRLRRVQSAYNHFCCAGMLEGY